MTHGRWRIAARALTVTLAASLTAACGTTTEPGAATHYSLATIDGARLPVGDKSSPGSVIIGGLIDFVASDSAHVQETSQSSGSVVRLDRVHVDRNGPTLVFRSYSVGILPDTAVLDANQLTVRHHVNVIAGQVVEVRVYGAL